MHAIGCLPHCLISLFYATHSLFARPQAPLLAYNHFVEALFVLNGCQAGLHAGRIGGGGTQGGGASSQADALAAAADTTGAFSLAGASSTMRWVVCEFETSQARVWWVRAPVLFLSDS